MIEHINGVAAGWWSWTFPMLWQTALLAGFVWALDLLLRRRGWPQVRYALWLLVFARLLVPPSFALPTSLSARLIAASGPKVSTAQPVAPPVESESVESVPVAAPRAPVELTEPEPIAHAPATPALSWKAWAMLASVGVSALLFVWLGAKLLRLRRLAKRDYQRRPVPAWIEEMLARLAAQFHLRRFPRIAVTAEVPSAAVCGVFRPMLFLPESSLALPPEQLEHVLLHELAHLKRRDLLVNAAQSLLHIIYWFNPALWFAGRQLRHLREICCDATVGNLLRERTGEYSQTLLELAGRALNSNVGPALGLLGLFESPSRLRQRIEYLRRPSWKHRRLHVIVAAAAAVAVLVCVVPMAAVKAAPAEMPKESPTNPEISPVATTEPMQSVQNNAAPAGEQKTIQKLLVTVQLVKWDDLGEKNQKQMALAHRGPWGFNERRGRLPGGNEGPGTIILLGGDLDTSSNASNFRSAFLDVVPDYGQKALARKLFTLASGERGEATFRVSSPPLPDSKAPAASVIFTFAARPILRGGDRVEIALEVSRKEGRHEGEAAPVAAAAVMKSQSLIPLGNCAAAYIFGEDSNLLPGYAGSLTAMVSASLVSEPVLAPTETPKEPTSGSTAQPQVQRREVKKLVSAFPPEVDLSTPESACAAYQRASGRMDAKAVVSMSCVPRDASSLVSDLEQSWKKGDQADLAMYNKAQLDAEIIEVLTYRNDLAEVITRLEFPVGKGRNPFSSRGFGCIDGKWKNLGEDRCASLQDSRADFERKKDNLWAYFEEFRKAGGSATPRNSVAERTEPVVDKVKAELMGRVEDFFAHNGRDITARKTLEWGDVTTDEKGNRSIRYKYLATIWDKEKMIDNDVFTFDAQGKFVGVKRVAGFPQKYAPEPADTTTQAGLIKLVEKFFSENFRDITARETIEWGPREALPDGNLSIRCKYNATIWDKDHQVMNQVFIFDPKGEFVSYKNVEGFPKPK
jgi:beta-lactamase regulating signal transducer with metallopeptidase domain